MIFLACFKHPDYNIHYFCASSTCKQTLFCQICYNTHQNTHKGSLKEIDYLMCQDIPGVIKGIKIAKLQVNCFFNQKMPETDKFFEQVRMKIETSLSTLKAGVMQSLENSRKHQEVKISTLLKTFEKFNRELVLPNELLPSQKSIELMRRELGNFLNFSKDLKNYEALSHITANQRGLTQEELSVLVEKTVQPLKDFSKLVISSQTEINFPIFRSVRKDRFLLENLKPIRYIENQAPISGHSVEFLTDKNIIVMGDLKGTLTLWSNESDNLRKLFKIRAHNDWISSVKYCVSKNLVISGSLDQTIKIFKAANGPSLKLIKTIKCNSRVQSLLVLEEKNLLISSGNLPNISMWDLQTFKLKGTIDTNGKGTTGSEMTYIPCLDLIAVSFLQGTIGLYDIKIAQEVTTIKTGYTGWRINSIQFLKKESLLIAGVAPAKIRCWKLTDKGVQFMKEYEVPGNQPSFILLVENEMSLLLTSSTKEVYNLNLESERLLELPQTGLNECMTLKIIPTKKKLVIADFGSRKIAVMTYV